VLRTRGVGTLTAFYHQGKWFGNLPFACLNVVFQGVIDQGLIIAASRLMNLLPKPI
jgi:hypothetical protein